MFLNSGSSFTEVNVAYTKPASSVMLTTGATERNSVLNIYDLAGNESEWTLEKSMNISLPSVDRGGSYNVSGSSYQASDRYNCSTSHNNNGLSFRSALW